MIRLLYQALLWLSLPAVLMRLEWRARREPEYGKRIAERMGRAPGRIPAGCIWFHSVSAGETIAVAPLIAQLASEFQADDAVQFLVTSMTPTGSAEVTRRLRSAVHHCYAPYDFRFAVRSFFDRVRPRLLVLVETELWPNLIGEAYRRGVPVVLVNARLSERSARGYRIIGRLTRRMLRQLEFVACQYHDHLERFRALGLRDEQVSALGSLKFDARLPEDHDARVAALQRNLGLGQTQVWTAGSTHPGEDELVLEAHARVCGSYPDSCLLLVPRHPVRGKDVAGLAERHGFTVHRLGATARGEANDPWGHESVRQDVLRDYPVNRVEAALREQAKEQAGPAPGDTPASLAGPTPGDTPANLSESLGNDHSAYPGKPAQVIVCDTMGQLQTLYGLSHIAFLGGSLVPVGGHNPIEAALCSQPLVVGPHTFNFEEVVAAFAAAQCLSRVETPAQLADTVIAAFEDAAARTAAGARALQAVEQNRGATERLLELLRTRIDAAST